MPLVVSHFNAIRRDGNIDSKYEEFEFTECNEYNGPAHIVHGQVSSSVDCNGNCMRQWKCSEKGMVWPPSMVEMCLMLSGMWWLAGLLVPQHYLVPVQ